MKKKSRLDMNIAVLQSVSKEQIQSQIMLKTRLNYKDAKALLTKLERLEMIRSLPADPKAHKDKGRPRRSYHLTPKGSKIIVRYQQLMKDLEMPPI